MTDIVLALEIGSQVVAFYRPDAQSIGKDLGKSPSEPLVISTGDNLEMLQPQTEDKISGEVSTSNVHSLAAFDPRLNGGATIDNI